MFTLQGGRRQDDAVRDDRVSVELRSVEEVSDARVGLRRPGVGSNVPTETFAHAERDDRVRLPDAAV